MNQQYNARFWAERAAQLLESENQIATTVAVWNSFAALVSEGREDELRKQVESLKRRIDAEDRSDTLELLTDECEFHEVAVSRIIKKIEEEGDAERAKPFEIYFSGFHFQKRTWVPKNIWIKKAKATRLIDDFEEYVRHPTWKDSLKQEEEASERAKNELDSYLSMMDSLLFRYDVAGLVLSQYEERGFVPLCDESDVEKNSTNDPDFKSHGRFSMNTRALWEYVDELVAQGWTRKDIYDHISKGALEIGIPFYKSFKSFETVNLRRNKRKKETKHR